MDRVFVVTAIEWNGERMRRAQVGEADVNGPSGGQAWRIPPTVVTLDELMELIETPGIVVASRTRSGTAGPLLCVRAGANGARIVDQVPIPQTIQDLHDISGIIK